jgi:hypothetical protein
LEEYKEYGQIIFGGVEEPVHRELQSPEMNTHTVVAWLKNRTLSSASKHLIQLFRDMYLGEIGEV